MSDQPSVSVYKSEFAFPFAMGTMLLGCFIYYATGNFGAVSVASAIASAICAVLAFVIVKNLTINLLRIQVYLGVVAYFFPLSYLGFIDNTGLLEVTNDELVSSSIMIIISFSIGWCLSFIFRMSATVPHQSAAFLRPSDIAILVTPSCLFQILMIITGKWSYDTLHPETFFEGDEPISPLIIFAHVTFAIGPLLAYNYGLLRRNERTWWLIIVTLGALALGTIFWLIDGRRSMATFVILSAVAFFHGRAKGRFTPKQIFSAVLIFLVLGLGIVQASKFFYSMRLASGILGSRQTMSMSVLDFLEYSSKVQAEPISPQIAQLQQVRPFVIESVGILLKYLDHHLYGKELGMQVISTIPNFLFPGKAKLTAEIGTQEDLWSKEYGFPHKDYANSFVLDGYVDFWYFGFTIYALVGAILVTFVYRFYSIYPALAYFCLFNTIGVFVQVEAGVPLLYFRDMMGLFIPLWIFYAVVESKTRSPGLAKFGPRRWPQNPGRLASPPLGKDISS